MSTDKPSKNEDEYFAREDAERMARLRARTRAEQSAAERQLHHMRCPKCGATLATELLHGVQIDRCPDCHGIWLDDGEIALLMHEENPGVLERVMGDLWSSLRKRRGKP